MCIRDRWSTMATRKVTCCRPLVRVQNPGKRCITSRWCCPTSMRPPALAGEAAEGVQPASLVAAPLAPPAPPAAKKAEPSTPAVDEDEIQVASIMPGGINRLNMNKYHHHASISSTRSGGTSLPSSVCAARTCSRRGGAGVCCMSHVACSMLQAACFMVHGACCVLHGA